jgi:DnaJ-class molecular chaperone
MSDADDRKRPAASRARKASSAAAGYGGVAETSAEETHEPRMCMPCRGSGKVISNLNGRTRTVTCPWCRGGGERLVGMDAQEYQREQAALKRR